MVVKENPDRKKTNSEELRTFKMLKNWSIKSEHVSKWTICVWTKAKERFDFDLKNISKETFFTGPKFLLNSSNDSWVKKKSLKEGGVCSKGKDIYEMFQMFLSPVYYSSSET